MRDLYLSITRHIHPASLATTIALDLLWSVFETGSAASLVGILIMPFLMGVVFCLCFGAVTLIQRYSAYDDWPAALSKGLALGIVAAIPFSIVGLGVAAGWGLMHLLYGVDQEVILLGKLARSWRKIELTLRQMAAPELKNRGLDEVIDHLHARKIISAGQRDHLHELRKQRNFTMHQVSAQELESLVSDVQAMEAALTRNIQ